jgi:hypothetical protein
MSDLKETSSAAFVAAPPGTSQVAAQIRLVVLAFPFPAFPALIWPAARHDLVELQMLSKLPATRPQLISIDPALIVSNIILFGGYPANLEIG